MPSDWGWRAVVRVSSAGVPKKIEAVTSWPSLSSPTDLRSFLGLCSYYRRFIHKFADTAMPLYRLLEKRQCFEWIPKAEEVFQLLKQKLTLTPIPFWAILFLIPNSSLTQMPVALYCVTRKKHSTLCWKRLHFFGESFNLTSHRLWNTGRKLSREKDFSETGMSSR